MADQAKTSAPWDLPESKTFETAPLSEAEAAEPAIAPEAKASNLAAIPGAETSNAAIIAGAQASGAATIPEAVSETKPSAATLSGPEVFRVAVDAPAPEIYSYLAPPGEDVRVGQMVQVPLRGRQTLGYVLAREPEGMEREFQLKPMTKVVTPEPLFGPDFVKLVEFVSNYYLYPPGLCVKEILPGGLGPKLAKVINLTVKGFEAGSLAPEPSKLMSALMERYPEPTPDVKISKGERTALAKLIKEGLAEVSWRLDSRGAGLSYEWWLSINPEPPAATPRLGPSEKELLGLLGNAPPTPLSHYRNILPNPLIQARSLAKKGLIIMESRERFRDDPQRALDLGPQKVLELTPDQAAAMAEIEPAIDSKAHKGFLLFGVTGSGKTEVYLRSAERTLASGRKVLWLAPEIALTMGLEGRLKERFPTLPLSVLHSGLTPGQRHDHWLALSRGRSWLALGARSAIFAPMADIGLIIVDEEHDWAYKQDDGLRYNGRDLAAWRARESGAVLILGTATPSLESFHRAGAGALKLLRMDSRPGLAVMPEVKIVDRRGEPKGGRSAIAPVVRAAMREAFDRGEQALMFINRRGIANLPLCLSCGEVLKCPHCNLALTLHSRGQDPKALADENDDGGTSEESAHAPLTRNHRLICHGCGYRAWPREECSKCGSKLVRYLGVGTQSLTRMVEKDFGKKGVRLDTDSARIKGGVKGILESFAKKEVDFLVGTQMAAKGHDFSHLTMVGVIEADLGLNVADFRAAERTFQILSQVSGRAGRRELPGVVYIQTRNPGHYSIVAAKDHDYDLFFESEISLRMELGYPPFARLALIRVFGPDERTVADMAERAASEARNLIGDAAPEDLELFGPAPAPMTRLREKYRYQMMLRSKTASERHRILLAWIPKVRKTLPEGVGMTVDVDPYNLL